MTKRWFQHNEVMAGARRLILSFYLYKIFGEWLLKLIAFFVATGAFLTSFERRRYSIRFFKALKSYTGRRFSVLWNSYLQFLNYGFTLCDKIISFSNHLSPEKFSFKTADCEEFFNLIQNKKGIFFLTTHVGNAEILRSLLQSKTRQKPSGINIFLEKRSCKVFNDFLNSVKINSENITSYAVEEVEMSTAMELDEKLKNGELIFMAGDRLSQSNPESAYEATLLNKKVKLPLGALKLAQTLEAPIFFIVCAKEKNSYNIHAKKFTPQGTSKKENLEHLKAQYSAFLEEYTLKYPRQFFHFYNFLEEN